MAGVTSVPRLDRVITLGDGRSLAYAEWGDPGGRPVVLFHGRPGSRLLCPDEDATDSLGVRLITIDRPGYGRSDPTEYLSLRSWTDDYTEFHALLGLPSCPIVGWSGGGPYALACAALAPPLVTSVGLAASVGPFDDVPGARDQEPPEISQLLDLLLKGDRARAIAGIRKRLQWFADDPLSLFDGFAEPGSPDDALLARPGVRERLNEFVREAARQGLVGLVADWIVAELPWRFAVADITHDVAVWLGAHDDPGLVRDSEYLAATIPRASFVIYPEAGHLLAIPHWREMLLWLH